MVTCGIDVGSLSAEAVVLENDSILTSSIIRTGPSSAETAQEAVGVVKQLVEVQ